MSKTINLGRVTAYADAVAAGYTGTREQFANDLANAANYAAEAGDAAETATEAATTARTAAETATDKAEEASADADQAHDDAQAILGAKETAVAAAATASSKAGEAANSAQQAAASETAAAGSATTASNAATSATASKNAAATSETNAANSANAAAQTLTNVNQAGATQVAAIQAKGTEVLNSIPADYTTLRNDVDDLKSDLNGGVYNPYTWEAGSYQNFVAGRQLVKYNTPTYLRTRKRFVNVTTVHVESTITMADGYSISLMEVDENDMITKYVGGGYASVANLYPDIRYAAVIKQNGDADISETSIDTMLTLSEQPSLIRKVYDLSDEVDALEAEVDEHSDAITLINNDIETIKGEIVDSEEVLDTLKNAQAGCCESITVHIPNDTGAVIENATIKLALHRGVQKGNTIWNEVWSKNFKKLFWNVRPFTENGDKLPYDLHATGRYDFVIDSKLDNDGTGVHHFSDGTLVRSLSGVISTSIDNAENWVNTELTGKLGIVDSRDRLFYVTGTHQATIMMVQYSAGAFSTPVEVLNLESEYDASTPNAWSLDASSRRWCEDSLKNIYYGLYRTHWGARIYKLTSTGSAMNAVYENSDGQHVHSMWYDNAHSRIYAGIDNSGSGGPIDVYSDDNGNTWTIFSIPFADRDYCLLAYYDGAWYGSGEAAVLGGVALYRTTDPLDTTKYVPVIDTHQLIRHVIKLEDGTLLAFGGGNKTDLMPTVYASTDNGLTWNTIFAEKLCTPGTNTVAAGATRIITNYFAPNGSTEKQYICTGMESHYGVRLYVGDNNYYALMFVNIGDIPNGGKDIVLETDYIITDSEIENTYGEIINPEVDVAIGKSDASVNGVTVAISGNAEFVDRSTLYYGGLGNSKAYERYAMLADSNSYFSIGNVGINNFYGTTIELDLQTPSSRKAKEIILSNADGSFQLRTSGGMLRITVGGVTYPLNSMTPMLRYGYDTQITTVTLAIDENGVVTLYGDGGRASSGVTIGEGAWNLFGELYVGKPVYASDEGVYNGICGVRIYDRYFTARDAVMNFYRRNYA